MKKILIYNSGGGLGDSIQIIPLLLSLKNHFPKSKFFYLGAHTNHFQGKLKEYNIPLQTLDLGIKYFGFRWRHFFNVKKNFYKRKETSFDLIIDLQSKFRNSLILHKIPHNHFYSTTFNCFFNSKKITYKSKDHLKNLEIFFNQSIKKVDFDYKKMPLNFLNESKRLLPKKNYVGFSITQGNYYRKKSWSIYKFITLANKVSLKNKIPVFFIEKNHEQLVEKIRDQVPTAIFPELNSNLSCPALVTALSARLEYAITIDNGIMHMMSLAKIPLVILFGPTDADKFAPSYNYITILDSKKIYNTENLESISVNDVLKKI